MPELTPFEQAALERLEQIAERLELLVALSIPPPDAEKFGLSGVEKQAFELCDMRHTADDMAKKLNKRKGHVEVTLTRLRKKGVVQSIKIGKKAYHVRVKA